MAETINWMYSVQATRGPTATLDGSFDADAYEKMSISLDPSATQDVTIGPGTWAEVRSLVVSADDLSGAVTIQPDGGTAAVLDAPFVLLGAGAVSLLGTGDATITLENTGADAVLVDIFVARDATP
jgi:hypothetical protein